MKKKKKTEHNHDKNNTLRFLLQSMDNQIATIRFFTSVLTTFQDLSTFEINTINCKNCLQA